MKIVNAFTIFCKDSKIILNSPTPTQKLPPSASPRRPRFPSQPGLFSVARRRLASPSAPASFRGAAPPCSALRPCVVPWRGAAWRGRAARGRGPSRSALRPCVVPRRGAALLRPPPLRRSEARRRLAGQGTSGTGTVSLRSTPPFAPLTVPPLTLPRVARVPAPTAPLPPHSLLSPTALAPVTSEKPSHH